jgi:hypothetical protein
LFLLFPALSPSSHAQTTHYFPGGGLSLQDLVNKAENGDVIVVAPGVYQFDYDNLTIIKEFLTIKSSHGPWQTILVGRGPGAVVNFEYRSKAVLQGFTITSKTGEFSGDLKGGGIFCGPESAPVITDNIITGNEAAFGAGIYCDTLSAPTIDGNRIVGNRAGVTGGGIFSYRSSAIISNNLLTGNRAANSGGGIGSNRDRARITNNILVHNSAGFGGGISCDRAATIISNNTLVDNTAPYGGGIAVEKGEVRLTNLILWHNTVNDIFLKQTGPAARPAFSLIGDDSFKGINGNISLDPEFVDPAAGNYHLRPGSPAIDTGSQDPFYMDVDGSYNDMGAYGGPHLSPRETALKLEAAAKKVSAEAEEAETADDKPKKETDPR